MAKLFWHFLFSLFVVAAVSNIGWADDAADDDEADEDNGIDSATVATEDSVLVLNPDNFDEVIANNPTILVEFYAPWCGHCKQLAPEYAAAAEELAKADPPVALAKVDATVHSALAERFEIQGYPTLKFFKDGKQYDYDGPRSKEGIIFFMKERAKPDWEPEPDAVITLTSENFDEVVNNEDLILVEFYAPWCGHCKRLAPTYEKAAKQLKAQQPSVPLAKVDATVETEIASRFGISGYPALKIFRRGRAFEYKGGRSEYEIVMHMTRQVGDGASEAANNEKLKEVFTPDYITIVGFFDSKDDPKYLPFKDVSDEWREDYPFYYCLDKNTRKTYKVNANSVVVFLPERFYTKHEPKWHVLEIKDDTTSDDIKNFVLKKRFPLVGHYHGQWTNHYDKLTTPLCMVFYTVDFSFDHRDATQMWRNKIANVAKQFPGITFAIADDEENNSMMENMGLGDSAEEMNIGITGSDKKKYPMEPMEEYDSEEITEFLNKFQKGKVKPYVKSQRPPKKQTGPVTIVVGNTFEKIVQDPSKDVLIEIYAPWCGHCKKLEPVYAALAKKLKKEKNLVIAKIDGTANDLPDNYSSTGFPTIYFAAANNKDTPKLYEGGREVDDFEKFLKEHATVSFGKNAKEEL